MGTTSMGFAVVEEPCTVVRIGIINLGTSNTQEAVANLYQLFTTGDFNLDIPLVMESQPTHGAPKCVSHALQMLYIERHRSYHFMAANDKLKLVPTWYDTFDKTTRADRKKLSMHLCSIILDFPENRHLMTYYKTHEYKQRTDIADAVVQAARYLQRQRACSTAQYLLTAIRPEEAVAPVVKKQIEIDASDQAVNAHEDEKTSGFKKRKYGDATDSVPVVCDFND